MIIEKTQAIIQMKVLYLSEYNEGGGAKSGLNLAIAASGYAQVAFFGIGYNYPEYPNIEFIKTTARKTISIKYIWDLKNSIKEIKPDIVHANGMYTGLLACILRPLSRSRYQIIITLRHTSTKFRGGLISRPLIYLLNFADILHYLTKYQKDLYALFGLKPKNFRIIPNIIYTHNYPSDEVLNLRESLLAETSSDNLIVYIGRIVESKQIKVFIEVISAINSNGYNVGGIIVGSGEKNHIESLKSLCEKLNISQKIVFAGYTKKPEIFVKAGDFCLFPTMWEEALPRFIIESFSQKRTLVVSNHPSIKGIVTDKYNTLVVKNHLIQDYTEACISLLKDTSLIKQLESGAETTYNNHYQSDKIILKYKDLYEELLRK